MEYPKRGLELPVLGWLATQGEGVGPRKELVSAFSDFLNNSSSIGCISSLNVW